MIIAYLRRLATDGKELYIRLDKEDVARHLLRHGSEIEINVGGKVRVSGIVKTSGSVPWLAPRTNDSNANITQQLMAVGFTHGDDMPSQVRIIGGAT